MPPTPRKKREAQLTTELMRHLRASLPTCAVEVKVAQKRKNGDRLCRSQVEPHQWRALQIASEGVLAYKIPDEGMAAKPFDLFVMRGVPAYLCAFFGRNFYLAPWRLPFEWFKTEASISEEEFERMSEYKGTL